MPPTPPSLPSGRYVHTNQLCRELGLKLLSEPLPEPLRTTLIRAWRRPGSLGWQPGHPEPALPAPRRSQLTRLFTPSLLGVISLTELEVSRRVVETPQNQHQPRHAQQAAARAGRVSAQPVCRAGQPVGRGRRAGRVPALAAQSRLKGRRKILLTFPRSADTFFIVGIIWTSAPMRSSQPSRTTLLREEGSNPCTSAS